MNIQPNETQRDASVSPEETTDRRELIQKLGRFAVYAAPFTILATTAKAGAASGSGKSHGPASKP
jgi:hypothetical protein